MVPYGLEALGTMRIEKGHVTGAEIDGRTSARDLHLGWMLSKKKPFIGSAMMDREGPVASGRLELVGLISLDNRPLNGGAHIVEDLDIENPHGSLGHITAACFSPALGKYIALALVLPMAVHSGRRWATRRRKSATGSNDQPVLKAKRSASASPVPVISPRITCAATMEKVMPLPP
jgi:glycine cleavage system aminomethyltransferase T